MPGNQHHLNFLPKPHVLSHLEPSYVCFPSLGLLVVVHHLAIASRVGIGLLLVGVLVSCIR